MNIELRFNKDMLVIDGALGTLLQTQGFVGDDSPLLLNVLEPETILNIHKQYVLSGANVITSNTFGGTANKLAEYDLADRLVELNRSGVRLAKAAGSEHVFADMGPCGLVMEPLGKATFEEMFDLYAEQAAILSAEKPDAIILETMVDIADARCALLAARSVSDLPIMVCCTFDESGHMELSGTTPEAAAVILESCGAAAVGINCSLGVEQITPLIERMADYTQLPLIVQANAGMPKLDSANNTYYDSSPDVFGENSLQLRNMGVQFIGSCCGTSPAFTSAIYGCIGGMDVVPRGSALQQHTTVLASPKTVVCIGAEHNTAVIGERINPTGKATLADQLEKLQMSQVLELAESQEAAASTLLDVNVGAPMVDEQAALSAAVAALQGAVTCPLVMDTTDYAALESVLKHYPGKALINSVNGDPESLAHVLPLAKKYGAAVIALCLDERGIPADVSGRMNIAERIIAAAKDYGIKTNDIIFDALTMAAASDENAPEVTLGTVHQLSERNLNTVLGVSNVSHGLPMRSAINAEFVTAAIECGLSAAIVNPNDESMMQPIGIANVNKHSLKGDKSAQNHADKNMGDDSTAANGTKANLDSIIHAWQQNYARIISNAMQLNSTTQIGIDKVATDAKDAKARLKQAVLRGDKDGIDLLIDEIVADGTDVTSIVDGVLSPTMEELGNSFAVGKVFLPQLIMAAESMKVAVARIKDHLPVGKDDEFKGKVVFCTVKGDVHSIGKDICIALLESQDYQVFDLGVDTEAQSVVDAAQRVQADVICLSALMTTTLANMKQTVELIFEQLPRFAERHGCGVFVGGAVVTKRWADSIGAMYSGDAPSCVKMINDLMAEKD